MAFKGLACSNSRSASSKIRSFIVYLVGKGKMAPIKGPSVLHAFFHHVVMMVMVMVHFRATVHVAVMHASVHSLVHHRLVFSYCGRSDRDRGQRRQHVGNLLHWSLLG
jgi:hypothetical protein